PKPRAGGRLKISLQWFTPPIFTYSGSVTTPLSSLTPEMSTTDPVTGRSPRAGKKSVPPARICPPELASTWTASSSVSGLKYKKTPLTANAKDVEQGRKPRLGVILIQAAGFV